MAEKEAGRHGCLKWGCASSVLVFLLVVACFAGGALMGAPEPDPRSERFERPEAVSGDRVGLLRLDLSEGQFFIEPAGLGQPLTIEAEYDGGIYSLEQSCEPGDETQGWSCSVRIASKLSLFRRIHADEEDDGCFVRVFVPRDLPFELDAQLSMGQSRLELGGLDLRSLDLDLTLGGHEVSFSEPTREPVKTLVLSGSMGECKVTGLGNASPEASSIEWMMGELRLGLDGQWRQPAAVALKYSAGAVRVMAPPEVRLHLSSIEIAGPDPILPPSPITQEPEVEPSALERPTVDLAVEGMMGEFRLVR